jgi:hypothetical protein
MLRKHGSVTDQARQIIGSGRDRARSASTKDKDIFGSVRWSIHACFNILSCFGNDFALL